MKRSNTFLWFIIILFVVFLFWAISTGRLDDIANLFINGFWNSIARLVQGMFHHR